MKAIIHQRMKAITHQLFVSFVLLLLSSCVLTSIQAWTTKTTTVPSPPLPPHNNNNNKHQSQCPNTIGSIQSSSMTTGSITTRRTFLPTIAAAATVISTATILLGPSLLDGNSRNSAALAVATTTTTITPDSDTTATTTSTTTDKLNLSDDALIQIIRDDIVQRQFLVTGNITKSIYAPYATFTDEIDTYGMDQWMIGTQRLFVGDRSQVRLISAGNTNNNIPPITFTSPTTIEFAFDEDLMFNLPIIKPVVSLTGKVVLTRDPNTGYIISYREFWDQDVATVLKSAKF